MPFVGDGEALDRSYVDLNAVADKLGPPPWRALLAGTPGMRVVLLHWPSGFATVPHLHPGAEETFQVIRGRAMFSIGEEPEREVCSGSFVLAKRGVRHAIRVPEGGEPLLLMAAVAPNEDRPDETIEPA
jgi:quercetin dioxygenase-like cupin family protein